MSRVRRQGEATTAAARQSAAMSPSTPQSESEVRPAKGAAAVARAKSGSKVWWVVFSGWASFQAAALVERVERKGRVASQEERMRESTKVCSPILRTRSERTLGASLSSSRTPPSYRRSAPVRY
jgi:hypothetical protein